MHRSLYLNIGDKKILGTFCQNRDQIGTTFVQFSRTKPINRDRIVSTTIKISNNKTYLSKNVMRQQAESECLGFLSSSLEVCLRNAPKQTTFSHHVGLEFEIRKRKTLEFGVAETFRLSFAQNNSLWTIYINNEFDRFERTSLYSDFRSNLVGNSLAGNSEIFSNFHRFCLILLVFLTFEPKICQKFSN